MVAVVRSAGLAYRQVTTVTSTTPPRQRTTSTGRSVRWITLCAVLPRTSPARSLLPLKPTMMMPASCSRASLTISRAACPYPAELPLPYVQHPHLALGQGRQIPGRGDHPRGDLRVIHRDQSLEHQHSSL